LPEILTPSLKTVWDN